MNVKNNDKVGKWFFYKVNGQTKKVNIPGQTSVELPDLISMSQVIRNGYDVKVDHINSLLNRRIAGDFTVTTTASGVIDYHLLDTWYASLSVKPTAGLWTDLQALANGMKSDGDWDEMDFMSMIACLETDEQRLRPLKTTAGEDMALLTVTTPVVLDNAGATQSDWGNGNDLNTKWNPVDNGVKFTLTSAFAGVYGDNNNVNGNFIGSALVAGGNGVQLSLAGTSTSISAGSQNYLNDNTPLGGGSKSGLIAGAKRYFNALIRSGNNKIKYINGVYTNPASSPVTSMLAVDLYLLGLHYENNDLDGSSRHTVRSFIAGSGNINPDRVAARLNTFFTARGLTISNY